MIHDFLQTVESVLSQLTYLWKWKAFFAGVLSTTSFFFGVDLVVPIGAVLGLVMFDFIVGSIVAYTEKTYCSKKAMKTAYKILMYGLLVSSAHFTDIAMQTGTVFEIAMVGFLGANEMISIMRNANKLGYQTPKRFVDLLTSMVKKS